MTAQPRENPASPDGPPTPSGQTAPREVAVVLDGRLVEPEAARISIFDTGFTHGDGLFETLLARAGETIAEEAHLDRLLRSAKALGLPAPPRATITRDLRLALAATVGALGSETIVRIQLTAGIPGHGPTRVVTTRPLGERERSRRGGLDLFTVGPGRAPEGGLGAHKSTSWMASAAARRLHPEGGLPSFEGLFVSSRGEVLEGTTTGICAVKAGVLRLPPLDGRALDSVTRGRVVQAAPAVGFALDVSPLAREELLDADEVLAMNALLPVVRCLSLDGVALGEIGAAARLIEALRS